MVIIPNNIAKAPGRYLTYGEMYIMDQLQRHIMDLAIWTKALVRALKFKLPDVEDIYKRLLEEPDDTREILASFFGLQNALIYENYLTQLIVNIRSLAEALLSNDDQKANESYKNLNKIANDMAEFFHEMNPSSSLDQWQMLLIGYVDMLYNEVYTTITGNYTGAIGLFDTIVDQSYLIADFISTTVLSVFQPAPPTQPSTPSAGTTA